MDNPTMPVPVPPGNPEETLWEGHPSQWIHVGFYLLMGFLAALVIPVLIFVPGLLSSAGPNAKMALAIAVLCWLLVLLSFFSARWIKTKSMRISVTTQRLRIQSGVFSRKTEDVELYRVKDISLEEPFFERTFGLANIIVSSTDVSAPNLDLKGLPGGKNVYEKMRAAVEARRASRRVSVTELE